MRRQLSTVGATAGLYAREHLRTPLVLGMIALLPAIFVVASAAVLSPFAEALGGNVAGQQATALGAGWSVAFMAGAIGFFQASSAREADRRLALAGLGPLRTALSRLLSALLVCAVLTGAALVALRLKQPVPHLAHTVVAMLALATIYLSIGTAIGVVIHDELAGSLAVVFIFILDVFSGPGMAPPADGITRLLTPSRAAGELLLRAGAGADSPAGDWRQAGSSVLVAVAVALGAFWLSARRRA